LGDVVSRLVAVLLAALLSSAPLSSAVAQTPKAIQAVTDQDRSDFRTGLANSAGGQTFALVIKHYPEEFRVFETDLLGDLKNGRIDVTALQSRTFTFMKSIRTRMMPYVQQAPTPKLIAFGEEQLSLMKTLRPMAPRLCYEYVELGGPSQDGAMNAPREAASSLNNHNSLQFEVAVAGEKSPTPREHPSAEDFTAVLAEYARRNGNAEWMKAISTGVPRTQSDTDRCSAAIVWIESILSQPPERAARLLAG